MSTRLSTLVVVMGLSLLPLAARADEAADKKAEIQRKKEEARKRAIDKAAADKAAADKAAADKAAADKAAADKAAADKAKTGSGGASGTGGAAGAGGKGNSGGAGGAAATKAADKDAKAADKDAKAAEKDAKAAEKDAPLPAGNSDALRKDRPERRKSSVERLRKRWGRVLANDKGAADLKLHARRVALLQRARVIAEGKKDVKSVELVDQLLTAEDERHSTAMNALREGALK